MTVISHTVVQLESTVPCLAVEHFYIKPSLPEDKVYFCIQGKSYSLGVHCDFDSMRWVSVMIMAWVYVDRGSVKTSGVRWCGVWCVCLGPGLQASCSYHLPPFPLMTQDSPLLKIANHLGKVALVSLLCVDRCGKSCSMFITHIICYCHFLSLN